MLKRNFLVHLFALFLSAISIAQAGVIFEKTLDVTAGAGFTSNTGKQQIAEDFQLSDTAIINSISWYGYFRLTPLHSPQPRSTFDILFLKDASGLPQTAETYSTTTNELTGVFTGRATSFGLVYEWTTSIPDIALAAGTYWISIRSNRSQDFLWAHAVSNGDGFVATRFDDDQVWQSSTDPAYPGRDAQAFTLLANSVPVPTTAALMLLGFSLLWAMRSTGRVRVIQPVALGHS